MHIPSQPTDKINILSFEEASRQTCSSYNPEEWIYVPDFYTEYRYVLGTRGKKPLICVGINPSTAEPGNLDNTLKSVERIAFHNGFDSFIMFNIYAQRATSPDDMDKEMNEKLHKENIKAFNHILSLSPEPVVWAAWGAIIEKRKYLKECLMDMIAAGESHGAKWFTAGKKSVKGHPHHPLYLRKDEILKPFDISEYLKSI